jgi:hypothetical protein
MRSSETALQRSDHVLQIAVSGLMPEGVVDALEMV